FFRQIYFIGSNERAARLSGISVDRVRVVAYVLTSVLAALAGIMLASRLMSGTPTAGNGLELQVLAAAVIGGASLRGGEGTVLGAFRGADQQRHGHARGIDLLADDRYRCRPRCGRGNRHDRTPAHRKLICVNRE